MAAAAHQIALAMGVGALVGFPMVVCPLETLGPDWLTPPSHYATPLSHKQRTQRITNSLERSIVSSTDR
eukprot:5222851-Alexandrium_andersonii.AAC.1